MVAKINSACNKIASLIHSGAVITDLDFEIDDHWAVLVRNNKIFLEYFGEGDSKRFPLIYSNDTFLESIERWYNEIKI